MDVHLNTSAHFDEFKSKFEFQLFPRDDIYTVPSLKFTSNETDGEEEFILQPCPSDRYSKTFLSEITLNQNANHSTSENDIIHECNTCRKTFSSLSSLKRHNRRIHLSKKPYTCIACHRTFLQLSLLSRHSLHHLRTKTEEFICQICAMTFSKSVILQKHIFSVHACEGKPFCFGCFKFFATKDELDNHMKEHLVSDIYDCVKCKKRYKNESELTKHRCIYNGPRPFLCKLCGKRFNRLYHLERHLDLHKRKTSSIKSIEPGSNCQEEKQNISVDSIKSVTANVLTLSTEDDILDNSLKVNKKFECYICNNRWSSFKKYKQHFLLMHHDVTFNACHICSKQFTKSSKVKRHLLVHSKAKDFKCEICYKTFTSLSTKKRHMKKHVDDRLLSYEYLNSFAREPKSQKHLNIHEISKTSDFKCLVCKKEFAEEKTLNEHILAFHDFFKEFQCNICERRFKRPSNLKQHMLLHTSQKRFKCFKCNKLFSAKSDLKEHSLTHEDQKSYGCYFCDKFFSQNCDRQKHLALCSRQKKFSHEKK